MISGFATMTEGNIVSYNSLILGLGWHELAYTMHDTGRM